MQFSERHLWKFLDGELDAGEAAAIETAAGADAGLARRLEEMRTIKREVLAGAPTPPPGFAERVSGMASRLPRAPVFSFDAARRLRPVLAAAALLVALAIGYWAGRSATEPLRAGPEIETGKSVEERVDEFRKRLGLDATQARQLRAILGELDARIRKIKDQVSKEQFRRRLAEEEASRERVRAILTEEQQREYDKLLGRG